MGPRHCCRGYYRAGERWYLQYRLQWGRDIAAADTCPKVPGLQQLMLLQWGRDIAAADTDKPRSSWHLRTRLQWGRDIAAADTVKAAVEAGSTNPSLQWGRDIAAADTEFPRSLSSSVAMLQWGRDIAAADTYFFAEGSPLGADASMGPRHCCRGYDTSTLFFTGSYTLQWGRDIAAADTAAEHRRKPCSRRFNGAATLLPRIQNYTPHSVIIMRRLQWGRDIAAADTACL